MYFVLEKGFKMRTHTSFLVDLLKGSILSTVAEVGVFKGDNAFGLLESLPIGLLIGVDPYRRYPAFDDNLSNKTGVVARADLKKVKKQMLQRMKPFGDRFALSENFSEDGAAMFSDELFDFVFIDGNHYYDFVCADIKAWLPKVKQGGILAGHDFVNKVNCGVIRATTELLPDCAVNLKAKVWWWEKPFVEDDSFEEVKEKEVKDVVDQFK